MPINYKKYCLILIVMIHTVYQTSAQEVLTKVNSGASWQPHPNHDGNGIYGGSNSLSTNTTVAAMGNFDLNFSGGNFSIDTIGHPTFYVETSRPMIGIGTKTPQSTLHINGSISYATLMIAFSQGRTYFVTDDDCVLFAVTSNGDATFSLPDPSDCRGRIYHFIKTTQANSLIFSSHSITVSPGTTQTNFSGTDVRLSIFSDGDNWRKLKN